MGRTIKVTATNRQTETSIIIGYDLITFCKQQLCAIQWVKGVVIIIILALQSRQFEHKL